MPTILVVDDVTADLDAMERGAQEAIKPLGGRVEIADSTESAIDKLQENEFDVVVTDLQLTPEKNNEGWDVLQYARKLNAKTRVIIVTGFASDVEDQGKSMSLGAFKYMGKIGIVGNVPRDLVEQTKAIILEALEAV